MWGTLICLIYWKLLHTQKAATRFQNCCDIPMLFERPKLFDVNCLYDSYVSEARIVVERTS